MSTKFTSLRSRGATLAVAAATFTSGVVAHAAHAEELDPAERVVFSGPTLFRLGPHMTVDGGQVEMDLAYYDNPSPEALRPVDPIAFVGDAVVHVTDDLVTEVPGWPGLDPAGTFWQTHSQGGDGLRMVFNRKQVLEFIEDPDLWLTGATRLTLHAVDGPGDVTLSRSSGGLPLINGAEGLPATAPELYESSGRALRWGFTEPGYYCLDFEMAVESNYGHNYPAREWLTVAVGNAYEPLAAPVCGTAGPGEPDAASQTIVATVDHSEGALVISVDPDDREVVMSDLALAASGDRYESTGELRPVQVTDTRPGAPGWNASGQVSEFATDDDSFAGSYLGWTPTVLSQADEQQVVPGAAVAPGFPDGDGLGVSRGLAAAPSGAGRGVAALAADLSLVVPTDVPPGTYTAVLTLTAI